MKKGLVLAFLVVMATLLLGAAVNAADIAVLISDYNKKWYVECNWDFDSHMNALRDTLALAELSYVELTDEDLAKGNFGDAKVLILPNSRRMSRDQIAATRKFLEEGGTLFALMQATFKDEANNTVDGKIFQMGTEFGVAYEAYSWKPPLHAFVKKMEEHPIFEGLPEFIQFHRNEAIVVKHVEGVKVLAEWYNDDQLMPSHLPEINAALVENAAGNVIYSGEMLFAPQQMEDPAIRTLATNIVKYLLSKSTRGAK